MSVGRWSTLITIVVFFTLRAESSTDLSGNSSSEGEYDWRVVRVFPHDTGAFTQGLIYRDGYLYESTGRKGSSSLRKVRLETGEVIMKKELEPEHFAEGLTDWNDQLVQLTLDSGVGFVYDLQTFERVREFQFTGDGWGLTNNSDHLITSNGTSTLRFLDPETFTEIRQLSVTENGEPVSKLNELEMIDGKIFANIYFSNEIVVIDPNDGNVTGRINLQHLVTMVKRESPSVNVLNGIAYDAENDRVFVTGKLWPNLFEIEIREK